ncbi:low temperature requirement protein A [Nocardioides rotundus]|uniref:low temperature requirement protein A n=1 Tax=Nocardioides rotundus TaxID=1774216 RepID=UPI001CC156DF|nr:low temperature requirement protein A [Nocardioides rotundus]UAL29726.1 low temperature requirement protein A [Nocardioides rotundus]
MSESQNELTTGSRPHGLIPMRGRDPHDAERSASPLELLYDLTVVVAFSIAGGEFAHAIVSDHLWNGLVAFAITMFAVIWAWLSFTWFASAYDTDDWAMRLAVLLQMIGVIIVALGVPALFEGMNEWHVDNGVVVAGYVVMRVAMITLWLRAAHADPNRRPALVKYAGLLFAVQVAWVVLALNPFPIEVVVPAMAVLFFLEMAGPRMIEGRQTTTPWHPHHIAERYGLIMIISFGEVILGTTTAVEAVVSEVGWSVDAALIALAGVAVTVGLWWNYFAIPYAQVLEVRSDKGWVFGLGHIPVIASVAGVGTGLHVAAYYIQGEGDISEGGAVLSAAVSMAVFIVLFFALVHRMLPGRDLFHVVLIALMGLSLLAAVLMGYSNLPLGWSLVVLSLTPWISVVGYETRGHGHVTRMLERVRSGAPS